MPSHSFYALMVTAAAALALVERLYALRNERRLRAGQAREVAPRVFLWMAPVYALHFVAAVAENRALDRNPAPALFVSMLALFALSKGLKFWAVLQLLENWTMRVMIPQQPKVVTGGPYRFVRHPNYVAVMGEIISLPLAGGSYFTAIVFGAAFLVILTFRVRSEEEALLRLPAYAAAMAGRNRFLPGKS